MLTSPGFENSQMLLTPSLDSALSTTMSIGDNRWAHAHWTELPVVYQPLESKEDPATGEKVQFAQCNFCKHIMNYTKPGNKSSAWRHTMQHHPQVHPKVVRKQCLDPIFQRSALDFRPQHRFHTALYHIYGSPLTVQIISRHSKSLTLKLCLLEHTFAPWSTPIF